MQIFSQIPVPVPISCSCSHFPFSFPFPIPIPFPVACFSSYPFILGLIYSQTTDFKSPCTVATLPNHQISPCTAILFGIKNYHSASVSCCKNIRLKIHYETTRDFSSISSQKENNSSCSSIGSAYEPIPFCSSYQIRLGII